jgi:hypothetical protein
MAGTAASRRVRGIHPSSLSTDNCDRSELSNQTGESWPGRLSSQPLPDGGGIDQDENLLDCVARSAVDPAEKGAGDRFGVGERHHVAGALNQRVLCVAHVLPHDVAERVVNGGRL